MRVAARATWADPALRERQRQAMLAYAAEEGIKVMDWTPEAVAALRAAWAAARTRDQIAAALGCTPNAVEGKARRLKLPRHPLAPNLSCRGALSAVASGNAKGPPGRAGLP